MNEKESMSADHLDRLEFWTDIGSVKGVASETNQYLSSQSGLPLAASLVDHIVAYNSTDDLVPYFGDYRLAHTEAFYQLRNSVCLAYHGFYSQAISTLRSVCELSLLQASLPEGNIVSDRTINLLRSMMPDDQVLPAREEANWVLTPGFGSTQTADREATSLAEWAIDGCRTPRWGEMLKRLLESKIAQGFNSETKLDERVKGLLSNIDPFVHARGSLCTATGLSSGNMLRFSKESLLQFGDRMIRTTQVSIAMLFIAFLPTSTSHPGAAAGFIEYVDLNRALVVLPHKDVEFFRAVYKDRGVLT
jgi:hypothetical protein